MTHIWSSQCLCVRVGERVRVSLPVCVCEPARVLGHSVCMYVCVYVHLPRKCFHRRWFYRCVSAVDRHVFVGLREDLAPRGCSCAAFVDPTVIF